MKSADTTSGSEHAADQISEPVIAIKTDEKVYIGTVTDDNVLRKAKEVIGRGQADAFYVSEVAAVSRRLKLWKECLPDVELFYAMKANNDEAILKKIIDEGHNFDCASMNEIEKVLALGALPSNIIFAHPVKKVEHIIYAMQKGINLMTFDCVEEAAKMMRVNPKCEGVLRIVVDKTDARCPLNKFGAPKSSYGPILDMCKSIGMKVRGVSFHVGSGGCSYEVYEEAVKNAKLVFEMVKARGMPELDLLDIGGGFSMTAANPLNNFNIVAPKIDQLLKREFPNRKKIRVIAEPGRFICQESLSLAMKINLAK